MARNNNTTIKERANLTKIARRRGRIMPALMSSLVVFISMVYLMSLVYTKFSSFSISVNKFDQLTYGLSLSETRDFSKPTSNLNCRASQEITNINGKDLDEVPLGQIDGEDNGENYLCYTFYCRNSGEKTVDYRATIFATKMSLGIEEAVRVRVISTYNSNDSVVVDYAYPAGVDSKGIAIPEEGTTPFYTNSIIMTGVTETFNSGDVNKYTIVIWIEGPDNQCIDDIIGGEFKIDMKFEIISSSIDS